MSAGANDIRAGGAYIELSTRDAKLKAGLADASQRVDAFANRMAQVGGRMMATGAAILAPFTGAIKLQGDLTTSMGKVATMLDDADMGFLTKFKSAIESMSVEFGEGTETIANGLYDILSAGVPAAGAIDVLREAMKAAAAGISDTGTAADAITTVLNSYQISAKEAATVSDWLFSIVKKGKTDFSIIAPTIGMVASTAAAAGYSLEELGGAIATMTRNGLKTNQTITGLNGIIMGFLKPTDQAVAAAKKFGIELNTATLRSVGLSGILKKLKESGATAEDMAAIFPNTEALRGVNTLMRDMPGLMNDISLMKDRAGQTQSAFGKATNNLGFELRQMAQALVNFIRGVGGALEGQARTWVQYLREILISARGWVDSNKELIVTLAKLGIGMVVTGASIMTVALAAKAIAIVFAVASIASGVLATVTKILGVSLTLSGVAFNTAAKGAWAYTSALLKSVALSLVAIASLAAIALSVMVLLDAFGLVETGINDLFQSIRISGSSLGAWVQGIWLEIFKSFDWFVQAFEQGWDWIATTAESAADTIYDAFCDSLNFVTDQLKQVSMYILEAGAKYRWYTGQISEADMIREIHNGKLEIQQKTGKFGLSEEDRASRDAKREMEYTARRADRAEAHEAEREIYNHAERRIFQDDADKPGFNQKLKEMIGEKIKGIAPEVVVPNADLSKAIGDLDIPEKAEQAQPGQPIGQEVGRATVLGTFSSATAGNIAANAVFDQQLGEQQKANEHLEKIEENTKDGAMKLK